MTRLHLMTWSLERSPVKSRLSRVPWSRSPRAPPVGTSYTGASLRRSRSVPRPCVLYVQLSGPIIMLLFGRRGHRQISTVTRFQAHPSGFLHWSRSPRAPPIGAFTLASSLRRSRSVPRPVVLFCFSGPIILLLFGRRGHRQISTVTRIQAHPCGFLHWARGPRSRAAGGSFLTGAVLKARSARWCLWLLLPIGA